MRMSLLKPLAPHSHDMSSVVCPNQPPRRGFSTVCSLVRMDECYCPLVRCSPSNPSIRCNPNMNQSCNFRGIGFAIFLQALWH